MLNQHAPVAQGIEHRIPNPCAAGSNPAGGTKSKKWVAKTVTDRFVSSFFAVPAIKEPVDFDTTMKSSHPCWLSRPLARRRSTS